jgi:hypothetical protein
MASSGSAGIGNYRVRIPSRLVACNQAVSVVQPIPEKCLRPGLAVHEHRHLRPDFVHDCH